MLIPITLPSSTSSSFSNPKLPPTIAKISHDEFVLIELQGALEIEGSNPRERDGKFIGTFKMDEATNKPTLLIGHHLLEGKVQTLAKPLGILVRNPNRNSSPKEDEEEEEEIDDMAVDNVNGEDLEQPSSGWTITAIVKKKIIFSKRPMPVMGKKL
ncbi:Ctf8-domain-containing protein [Crepidotus variabilis]|uniref:Ctf8-domain-containing protein n=1 Tax=Crepidotus variabilis TaxID=179855 RepID=A0A9P6JN55_9AGAR|nr:Ctf8-domain-containing protein [Crepidotus variabilis]